MTEDLSFGLWQPEDVQLIFQSYEELEKRMVGLLRLFPLTKENEQSWSPEMVNLFLSICSLTDSTARHILADRRGLDEFVSIKDVSGATIEKKVRDLNIDDFETNLFAIDQLTTSRVVVYAYPLEVISPYTNYRNPDEGWWSIYNRLKHNRFTSYRKANLINTLQALAGLFLLIVRHKDREFTKALLRFEFFTTSFVPELAHNQRTSEGSLLWYESVLFGSPSVPAWLPEKISNINPAVTSPKFQRYFGRYNPI